MGRLVRTSDAPRGTLNYRRARRRHGFLAHDDAHDLTGRRASSNPSTWSIEIQELTLALASILDAHDVRVFQRLRSVGLATEAGKVLPPTRA
jgi:hypothetical protein